MLPHLCINDSRYVPPVDQLRKQARFLRDHCYVKLNHAYEMVAYFYRFSNWADLNNYINSNTAIENHRNVTKMREVLQTYRSSMPVADLLQISHLTAQPGTLTEAVENDRLKALNDLDIVQFYNCMHDLEYWCEPVPVSWYKVLDDIDRCLVLLAKRTVLEGHLKTVNPHISFPWFGCRMYGYLYVNGSTLNYECRELDSYIRPFENKHEKIFSKPWFVSYISGFIRTQLRSLCASGFSGKISFARINIVDLVAEHAVPRGLCEYNDSDTVIRSSIKELVETLYGMGGDKDSKNRNITFTFGNGEVY